jgi:hypothetical protein
VRGVLTCTRTTPQNSKTKAAEAVAATQTRPIQPADQRYENAYLFGAIRPARAVGASQETDASMR